MQDGSHDGSRKQMFCFVLWWDGVFDIFPSTLTLLPPVCLPRLPVVWFCCWIGHKFLILQKILLHTGGFKQAEVDYITFFLSTIRHRRRNPLLPVDPPVTMNVIVVIVAKVCRATADLKIWANKGKINSMCQALFDGPLFILWFYGHMCAIKGTLLRVRHYSNSLKQRLPV